jgi:hypothetical protein
MVDIKIFDEWLMNNERFTQEQREELIEYMALNN